jgi:TRAP transporter TAXI family solute receptor
MSGVIKRKLLQWCAVAAICVLGAGAGNVAAQGTAAKSDWPVRLTFVPGPVGGFGYPLGSTWASIISAAAGIPISVEATAGFSVSLSLLDDRKAELAMVTSDLSYEGWEGADWSQMKKLRNQRTLMVWDANVMHFYTTTKTGIKSLSQIGGRSANPSRRRSGADLMFRDIMELLGIKPSRISNANPADANSLLGDGQLDVASVSGTPPHPAIMEFQTNHDIVLIGMSDAEREKFLKRYPYISPFDIPANTYKGQTAPVKTVASYVVIATRADIPDSLAYALVKETYARKATLVSAHKSFTQLEPKSILQATTPLHPGAAKFYEEQGVKLPEKLRASK